MPHVQDDDVDGVLSLLRELALRVASVGHGGGGSFREKAEDLDTVRREEVRERSHAGQASGAGAGCVVILAVALWGQINASSCSIQHPKASN